MPNMYSNKKTYKDFAKKTHLVYRKWSFWKFSVGLLDLPQPCSLARSLLLLKKQGPKNSTANHTLSDVRNLRQRWQQSTLLFFLIQASFATGNFTLIKAL